MPLVMQEYPNSSASRACSNISRKRTCMSSPCGNCARIINPNCMSAMACSLSAIGPASLAGQLAVRSTHVLSDVGANAFDGLLTLREHRSKEVPDVDHLLADFEGDVYSSRLGTLRQAGRVIE